jgi:alanine racemase
MYGHRKTKEHPMVKHSSRIYLSQTAVKKNINFLRKKIGPGKVISAVVKANAYGHGIEPMVHMLERAGIHHFSVASAFEAEEVLDACSDASKIMIMGILYDEDIHWAIEHGIEFYVFDYDRLKRILEIAKTCEKKAIIHVEVETGTNRTGMNYSDFKKAITFLKKHHQHIQFEGSCSHLGGAENRSNEFKLDVVMMLF